MAHVNRHETMLYKVDSKLMILNKTLQSVMVQLSYFRYENNLIDNMQMHINCIYTAIYALKGDINALYVSWLTIYYVQPTSSLSEN